MESKDVFLVNLTLPDHFTKEIWDLIPAQRNRVNNLLEEHVIKSYSLDMDRRNLWVYVVATDLKEVNEIIRSFPIFPYVKVRIHELAFYDTAPVGLPEIIMN